MDDPVTTHGNSFIAYLYFAIRFIELINEASKFGYTEIQIMGYDEHVCYKRILQFSDGFHVVKGPLHYRFLLIFFISVLRNVVNFLTQRSIRYSLSSISPKWIRDQSDRILHTVFEVVRLFAVSMLQVNLQ